MSDRIAVMNGGRVEQIADPEDVYERPATTFVAGFIGVSNLMPAAVTGADEVRLDHGPTVRVPTNGLSQGERCHAIVRPEKLSVEQAGSGNAGERPRIEGVVESSLYLGTATQMIVDLGDEVRMTVLCPNASEAERQSLPGAGVRVVLSWEPEQMHVVRAGPTSDGANGEVGTDAKQS